MALTNQPGTSDSLLANIQLGPLSGSFEEIFADKWHPNFQPPIELEDDAPDSFLSEPPPGLIELFSQAFVWFDSVPDDWEDEPQTEVSLTIFEMPVIFIEPFFDMPVEEDDGQVDMHPQMFGGLIRPPVSIRFFAGPMMAGGMQE